jgi:signal peptidase I
MSGLTKFLFWTALVLAGLGVFLYFAFFDVWKVPGDDPQFGVSIEPTLSVGDLVLVARHGSPSRGNLVRCADPDEPRRFVVGRWMAQGRERVDFLSESITIDGQAAASPRGCGRPPVSLVNPATGSLEPLACRQVEFAGQTHEVLMSPEHLEGNRSMTVDLGKIFLASDNRHMHLDSRDFGSIDPSSCQHIVFRLWGETGFADASHRFTIVW